MNMTIFLVCTIFCSIQKLNENENNIMNTNKRKFINEKNITFEDNLINIYNEYPNEEPIIKKQKHIENNNFYEDNNHLKSHNYLIFEEFTDINNESNNSLNNINDSFIINNDAEYCSCDIANNFEKIFSIDDVCNREDFIYYCNQFSLELLDNINHDNNTNTSIIRTHKEKKERNATSLNLNITHNKKDTHDTILLKISINDIKRYASLIYFINIFDIIFQDLLTIFKNCTLVLNIENEKIKNFVIYLELQKNCEQKILALIKITNEVLTKNIYIDCTPNIDKYVYIESIIKISFMKYVKFYSFQNKLFFKRNSLINQINNNKINYKDIFDFVIENLKSTTDDEIRMMCILGLKNIFIFNLKEQYYRLLNMGIVLYAFNCEKKYYDVNWREKLFNILFLSNIRRNKLNYTKKICEKNFKNKLPFFKYNLYIAMNTLNFNRKLRYYLEIQKNTSQLKFIHYLIDAVNNIKCRLLNIEYIKKIDHLT
ncbi:hypothetical protein NAPIS_ORF00126 [Vairimorpha apis BRL 01]|uniref:Uncharacterized protein n=1 Tax=Vairimorpha apis BRL 01 TaxID=1037528 RepID=T0MGQ5_9MICR|nr:hypothetical protein NAPIS_ORF00126 [Vairimorpha apis BRL 01]